MGCGCGEPKNVATYICKACGKEERKEEKFGEQVTSCCGQPMEKKQEGAC